MILFFFSPVCGTDLANVGFFEQNNQYFCPDDFQERFGTKCIVCHLFVEGEGINIGGNAYHLRCFVCTTCGWVVKVFFFGLVYYMYMKSNLLIIRHECVALVVLATLNVFSMAWYEIAMQCSFVVSYGMSLTIDGSRYSLTINGYWRFN